MRRAELPIPDRIYFDLHAARLSPSVAHGNVAVSGGLLTRVRVAQNQFGIVRVVFGCERRGGLRGYFGEEADAAGD